jgi:riboflavin synthase
MFSGIVEEAGTVARIEPGARSIRLAVRARRVWRGVRRGASVAVNGCCLTVVKVSGRGRERVLEFDLLQETWRLTNLQFARVGSLVNLERSLRVGGELGGHFVTGHIDGLGRITRWERVGRDHVLDIAAPREVMRFILYKGSIAVDGISLTIAQVLRGGFRVWIIPHTYEVTALRERRVGDAVNLEADLLGKYVAKLLGSKARL